MRKTITITIDKDLLEDLKSCCKSNGYKISNYIEKLINTEIEKEKTTMKKFYIANRETGTIINYATSFKQALLLLKEYEDDDKNEGIFEENFYDILDENKNTMLYN